MKIQIVDKEDNFIGLKERGSLNFEKDIYRVSALWITDSEGKILLARRAFDKKQNPGKWGPAVAGTVDEGETYEVNIVKEAEEELGIRDVKFKKMNKEFVDGKYKHFTQWFLFQGDFGIKDFKINKEEVAEAKFFTKQEILDLLNTNPGEVLDGMKKWVGLF